MRIDPVQVRRYLWLYGRKPGEALERRIDAMRDAALAAIRPARIWRRLDDLADIDMRGSKSLSAHMAKCHAAYLACGTIGAMFDALQRSTAAKSAADAFILQAIGAAAIEELMDTAENDIRSELAPGERLVRRFSPGYGDYPLEAQRELLATLDAPRTVGVSLTDALVMAPSKSVSAIIGVESEDKQ